MIYFTNFPLNFKLELLAWVPLLPLGAFHVAYLGDLLGDFLCASLGSFLGFQGCLATGTQKNVIDLKLL